MGLWSGVKGLGYTLQAFLGSSASALQKPYLRLAQVWSVAPKKQLTRRAGSSSVSGLLVRFVRDESHGTRGCRWLLSRISNPKDPGLLGSTPEVESAES